MALNTFDDKSHSPTDRDLKAALGKAYPPWRALIASVAEQIGPVTELWAFTSASTGWGLRLRRKDRVILYMSPRENHFIVSFALGEKAVAAAQEVRLPAAVRDAIASAPRYAEGRGVRMTIKSARQLPALAKLAQIKWSN